MNIKQERKALAAAAMAAAACGETVRSTADVKAACGIKPEPTKAPTATPAG